MGNIVAQDTFVRANQSGWGTASDGNTWVTQQAGSTLSIASNEGLANGNAAARSILTLGSTTSTDGMVLFRFAVGATANNNDTYAICRYLNTSNYYWLGYNWLTSTTAQWAIRKRVAGVNTTLVFSAFVATPGTFYWIRALVQGSNLYLRAWQDGTGEPSTWTLSTTDTALTTGTLWGVGPFTNGTGTSINTDHFSVDDLSAAFIANSVLSAPTSLVLAPSDTPEALAGNSALAATASVLASAGSDPLAGNSALAASASILASAGSDPLAGNAAISASASILGSGAFQGNGVLAAPTSLILGFPILAGNAAIAQGLALIIAGAGSTSLAGNAALAGSASILSSGDALVGNSLILGSGSVVRPTLATVAGIVFLPNALLTIARGVYSAGNLGTSAPVNYLDNVLARIEPFIATSYKRLPAAALEADYTVTVAAGADINAGSRITFITALDDVTIWPDDAPTANEFWEVIYADETAAAFLPQRILYVKRVTGGGTTTIPVVPTGAPAVVFLPSVLLSTARPAYNATTLRTSAPVAHLSGVRAHIERNAANAYTVLPQAALDADYVAHVASGTDVITGDRVTAITLFDGVTPWPSFQTVAPNEVWQVVYAREMSLAQFPQRAVYIGRVIGGGLAR